MLLRREKKIRYVYLFRLFFNRLGDRFGDPEQHKITEAVDALLFLRIVSPLGMRKKKVCTINLQVTQLIRVRRTLITST